MTDYILFDRATGDLQSIVSSTPEHIVFQTMGGALGHAEIEGQFRSVDISDGVITQSFNLDAVRGPLLRRIDAEALAIVADPFAAIHSAKADEARGDGNMPLIAAEAIASGKTQEDLAQIVIARANASKAMAGEVELKRIAAKQAVRAATTIRAMVAAAAVDWAPLKVEG